jgi:hypothetical protein
MKRKCVRPECKAVTTQGICDMHQAERLTNKLAPFVLADEDDIRDIYFEYLQAYWRTNGCRYIDPKRGAE